MPYGFGPSPGPRQGPDGRPFDWRDTPRRRAVSVGFLTDGQFLSRLLPPGFAVVGEPVVTVEVQYYTELEWLAGRGYNTLGVKFPAMFKGERDTVRGLFLAVLWENLADPILTGRDELGFAKLYADIPEPRIFRGAELHGASWLGHRFIDLELRDIADADPAPAAGFAAGGTLHYKYVPSTGERGGSDVAYACHTPSDNPNQRLIRFQRAKGDAVFHQATWEQMPTQFHVVNALAALPVLEWRGATLVETRGGKDLSDQRRLR
jgi:hypothetical protein